MRKYFFLLLKISLFGLVVWLIFQQINPQVLGAALGRFSPLTIVGVIICEIGRQGLLAKRMQHAAALNGIKLPWVILFRWEFEILFLEQAIPLPDAEDIFRVFFWQKYQAGVYKTFTALLFSRVCGLFVVSMLLPFTFFAMTRNMLEQNRFPTWFLFALPVIILILTVSYKKILGLLAGFLRKIKFVPRSIPNTINEVINSNIPVSAYMVAGVLILFQFICISGSFYVLIFSSGVQIGYLQIFLATPLILLAFLIPLSVQGLGIPEAVMVWVMVHYHIKPEVAAAISIVHFACYASLILVGGGLVLSKNRTADIKKAITEFKGRLR